MVWKNGMKNGYCNTTTMYEVWMDVSQLLDPNREIIRSKMKTRLDGIRSETGSNPRLNSIHERILSEIGIRSDPKLDPDLSQG